MISLKENRAKLSIRNIQEKKINCVYLIIYSMGEKFLDEIENQLLFFRNILNQ